ncbi:MAG: MBL fold metallo-hydrolase [Bacteroidota bacterium]
MKNFLRQFGGKVTPQLQQRYARSSRWQDGKFHNYHDVKLDPDWREIPGMLYRQVTDTGGRRPEQPLPILPFDKDAFLAPGEKGKFVWYGHSALLLRLAGKTVLLDPMLGPDTTPIVPSSNRRFSAGTLELVDDFPPIDLVLLTHDHYDHLDYASIQRLLGRVGAYYVALGVGRHLERWGVDPALITEFDWYESHQLDELAITFTPTQHFSGRGLSDRMQTLWGGWLLATPTEKIWFSGDGGYNEHFREIGEKLGPFDLAFMECGQYNDDWRPVHLFPDEAVRAATDAGVRKAIPVHWGGFNLSYQHTWREPAAEFIAAARAAGLAYALPRLGQIFTVDDKLLTPWWEAYP